VIPYQPSNGTEGDIFMDAFCFRCERDRVYQETEDTDYACEILTLTMALRYKDPDYPEEWVSDDDGHNPRCTAFCPVNACPIDALPEPARQVEGQLTIEEATGG
jgi:hypothetical protein